MPESRQPKQPSPPSFGARLRALRRQAGLSQDDLSLRVAVWKSTIARIERGEQAPSWLMACRLAWALGVNVQAFLDD